VREVRSNYYPTVYGSLTGAGAETDSRIAAGGLNNPIIYNRYANGVTLSQLVTDFGRTKNLAQSSSLRARAEQENVTTTRADVLLQVDRAYYDALKAQAVLRVAQEAVKTRQLVADQVSSMAKNKLKSGLDVSFANVNLADAKLLLVQAENNLQSSFAQLSEALGSASQQSFELADDPLPPPLPSDFSALLEKAFRSRPELAGQRYSIEAAQKYAQAQRDLWFPTVSALGTAGVTPFHQEPLRNRYAAAGININIPVFNGHLFSAYRAEADLKEHAEEQRLRGLQDQIARDVRVAWLNAKTAFQRLDLTNQLLQQATLALDLAQARYGLGLSSIVELSQAQLNKTQAEIEQASAKYDFQARNATLNYQVGALH
jgi:outer membrane protein